MTTDSKKIRPLVFKRRCGECGVSFMAADRRAEFCSTAHRIASANRRRDRGAMLYDLLVHLRFNRAAAKEKDVYGVICRAVSNFVTEDRDAGRRPARKLQDALETAVKRTATNHTKRRAKK